MPQTTDQDSVNDVFKVSKAFNPLVVFDLGEKSGVSGVTDSRISIASETKKASLRSSHQESPTTK
jgi:hypothetical protein